jgi:3-dehydroquinate synthase
MRAQQFTIADSTTHFYFDASLELLKQLAPTETSFIITDENVMLKHEKQFKPWKVIVIPAGESSKNLETLDDIIRQLIALDADRDATIVGIGGGVVTDMAGFVAGIYKRGVKCGFVPTSILAMVDASLGGKNGLDIGEYKNMVGLIRQPSFILYDYNLLKTLPKAEWINGFAEIIKHACILNAAMFTHLEKHTITDFQNDEALLADLIEQNVTLKMTVVKEDEFEIGVRKLLNFGHTLAHAIENVYDLPHGHAVSIGMAFAVKVSADVYGFEDAEKVLSLLEKYQLTTALDFNKKSALAIMQKDKKKIGDFINYILLNKVGMASIKPLTIKEIEDYLNTWI